MQQLQPIITHILKFFEPPTSYRNGSVIYEPQTGDVNAPTKHKLIELTRWLLSIEAGRPTLPERGLLQQLAADLDVDLERLKHDSELPEYADLAMELRRLLSILLQQTRRTGACDLQDKASYRTGALAQT